MKNNLWIIGMPKYSILIFVSFNIVAILLYPGGTIHNEAQMGYSFTHNFFSDLGQTISHSNVSNIYSCILFNSTLIICGITFIMLFYSVRNLFKYKKLTFIATLCGILGGLSYIGVALTPSNIFLDAHIFFAHSIFRLLFVTAFFYSILIFKTSGFDNKYGYGFIVFGIMILSYLVISEFGPDPRISENAMIMQAIAQKTVACWILISIYTYSIGLGKYINSKLH